MIASFKPRFEQREVLNLTAQPDAGASDALAYPVEVDFSQYDDHGQDKDVNFSAHGFGLPPVFTPRDSCDDLYGSAPPQLDTPGASFLQQHWASQFHHAHQQSPAMVTPASVQSSLAALNASTNFYPPSSFGESADSPNPFRPSSAAATAGQNQTFAPRQFMHLDAFDTTHHALPANVPDAARKHASVNDVGVGPVMQKTSAQALPLPHIQRHLDNFRFHVTLKAPTAMLSKSDSEEATITYLNKRQPYPLTVTDSRPKNESGNSCRYRTSVRVCFDDTQQRAKPVAFWQLFRDGRGINEASSRGGKLQAVEWVDGESGVAPNVKLESTFFDGFCFTWSANNAGSAECTVQALFNFLSTDFSHSKGVKGVAVRLCVKTEVIGTLDDRTRHRSQDAEIAYCKVKTFRDHGAERKLANDKSAADRHVKKLNEAIEQAAKGSKESSKRRRSDSIVGARPAKVAKHSRTWSVSSASSSEPQEPQDDDLQTQLRHYEGRFKTAKLQTWLYLRGEVQDDPDLHPVEFQENQRYGDLGADLAPSLTSQSTHNTSKSTNMSPTLSAPSAPSVKREQASNSALASPESSRQASTTLWDRTMRPPTLQEARFSNPQGLSSPPTGPTAVRRPSKSGTNEPGSWIEVMGTDPTYQPVLKVEERPVACLYIKPSIANEHPQDEYYRAVYLKLRTVEELLRGIALKSGVEPSAVEEVLRVTQGDIPVKVDDDVVAAIPEGQDILAEFYQVEDQGFTFFDSVDDVDEAPRYLLKLRYSEAATASASAA